MRPDRSGKPVASTIVSASNPQEVELVTFQKFLKQIQMESDMNRTVFCYWPHKNVSVQVKKEAIPDKESWSRYRVSVLGYAGRYDVFLPVMNCRPCLASWTAEVVDMLFSGYWPGTVKFQTIYQVDLFASLEITAPGLSRQAFVKMLQQRSQQFGRSGNICGNVFQKAFLEWTYCRHKREKLCGIDHFSCPACTPDTVAVAEEQPFFDGVFLANDKDVATFVDCVREKTIPVHGKGICGT
ncbi:hypothetical protein cypCar_00038599 [Cyprinus carpio]|nr:hypothetical protein cypCar_00038599 [Cyprinus carpio]